MTDSKSVKIGGLYRSLKDIAIVRGRLNGFALPESPQLPTGSLVTVVRATSNGHFAFVDYLLVTPCGTFPFVGGIVSQSPSVCLNPEWVRSEADKTFLEKYFEEVSLTDSSCPREETC